jgi:hypothetical protein
MLLNLSHIGKSRYRSPHTLAVVQEAPKGYMPPQT